jgi:hypothetical protein
VKHLFYYWDAFLTDGWRFGNLATNGNGLDFRMLSKKILVNEGFARARLLGHADTSRLYDLLFNRKFLREEGQLRIVNEVLRRLL